MGDGGKGSSPRPYSVSKDEFDNNFDRIFGKKNKMTPSVEQMKKGSCGCGRSPSGDCCGWHNLSEEDYREELAKYEDRIAQEHKNAKS